MAASVKLRMKEKPNQKLPTQAQVILVALEALGGRGTIDDVIEKLEEHGLVSVQTPRCIWNHYRKRLLEGGFIELVESLCNTV